MERSCGLWRRSWREKWPLLEPERDLADRQGAEAVEARIARRTKRLKALELGVVIREQFVARPA